jgi:RNA polymerase sigma-70 factor (ECF subfamily)
MNFEKDVYQKYYALVYSACQRALVDKTYLDDAIQSTFLLYIKEEDKIKSDLASWFYWSAKNVSFVVNSDSKKQKQAKGGASTIKVENKSVEFSLDKLLNSLPKNKKELLLLRFYEEKTYAEIANIFHSNEDTIRSRINSTIELLRGKLNRKEINLSIFLITFFKPETTLVISKTPYCSTFILQNSAVQQNIVNGVYKLYLYAKIKIASAILLATLVSVGVYLPLKAEFTNKVSEPIQMSNIVKVSDIKLYDNCEVRFFYPIEYNALKTYPAIFACVAPGTVNVDHSVWKKFAEEGFIVIQLIQIRFDIKSKMTYKVFFEAMQKDIRLDLQNMFALDFTAPTEINANTSGLLAINAKLKATMGINMLAPAYKELNVFRGVISICNIHDSPPIPNSENTKLPILVITGSQDYNLKQIQTISARYLAAKFAYTLEEIEGLDHQIRLSEVPLILKWCHQQLVTKN